MKGSTRVDGRGGGRDGLEEELEKMGPEVKERGHEKTGMGRTTLKGLVSHGYIVVEDEFLKGTEGLDTLLQFWEVT